MQTLNCGVLAITSYGVVEGDTAARNHLGVYRTKHEPGGPSNGVRGGTLAPKHCGVLKAEGLDESPLYSETPTSLLLYTLNPNHVQANHGNVLTQHVPQCLR